MSHTIVQLRHRAVTFFFAHVIQALDGLLQSRCNLLLHSGDTCAVLGGIERARQLQPATQARLGADAELSGHAAKGAKSPADEVPIPRERRPAATLKS